MRNWNQTSALLLDHKQNISSNIAYRSFSGNLLFADFTQQHNFLMSFSQETSFSIQKDKRQKADFLTVQSRSSSNISVLCY